MDYKGQQLAERVMMTIMILFSVIGFLVGWKNEDIGETVRILGTGAAISAVCCVPNWPFYNKNPIQWSTFNKDKNE